VGTIEAVLVIVPVPVASDDEEAPVIQYSAKTLTASVAKILADVKQLLTMFVDICEAYSSEACSSSQKHDGWEPAGHDADVESSITPTMTFLAHGLSEEYAGIWVTAVTCWDTVMDGSCSKRIHKGRRSYSVPDICVVLVIVAKYERRRRWYRQMHWGASPESKEL